MWAKKFGENEALLPPLIDNRFLHSPLRSTFAGNTKPFLFASLKSGWLLQFIPHVHVTLSLNDGGNRRPSIISALYITSLLPDIVHSNGTYRASTGTSRMWRGKIPVSDIFLIGPPELDEIRAYLCHIDLRIVIQIEVSIVVQPEHVHMAGYRFHTPRWSPARPSA